MENKDHLITLGQKIRDLRKSKSISQEQLAHIADLDRSYIGSIERGLRNVSFLTLVKIASFLECKVSDLTKDIPNDR